MSVIWEIIRHFFESQACPIDVAFYGTRTFMCAAGFGTFSSRPMNTWEAAAAKIGAMVAAAHDLRE